MLLAGICKIQIFNSFHLSMIKFRNLSSHMRGTIRWPLHLDDCACGQKSSCTNQYPIAPRATRHRPVQKIISEMSFNLITNFSPCEVGCAPALTAPILAKPRIRVPQDFSGMFDVYVQWDCSNVKEQFAEVVYLCHYWPISRLWGISTWGWSIQLQKSIDC